jgi:hypothetical protein
MVLTKDELIAALQGEIRVLLHLASKVAPGMLDYRPTPRQRSLPELLQYLTIMPGIHLRTITSGVFNMDAWSNAWRAEEAVAKTRNLEQAKEAIGKQAAMAGELVGSCSDADLRSEMVMFGMMRASRGALMVSLVLCHYAAYRMQLFLYLKACGREELSTLNLWAGMDAPAQASKPASPK